jgi:hypothetical protein
MLNLTTFWTLFFPQKGTDLSILNQTDKAVFVYSDGEFIGRVGADKGASFAQKNGDHRLSVLNKEGDTLMRSKVQIEQGQAAHFVVDDPQAWLSVHNDSGSLLFLRLNGDSVGRIAIGEERRIAVEPGRQKLAAFYRLQGEEVLLQRQKLNLNVGAEQELSINEATSGWLTVDNDLNRKVEVRIDGISYERLEPGEQGLLNTSLGDVEVSIYSLNGEELSRDLVDVEPYRSQQVFVSGALAQD